MKQLSLAALLVLSTLAACKKDDDDNNITPPVTTPTCRITRAVLYDGSDSSAAVLAYNTEGRLTSVTGDGEAKNFTYSGNTIYATGSGRVDTITTNSNGLVTEQHSSYTAQGGTYTSRTVYTYNGTELQRAVSYSSLNGQVDTSTTEYTWSGGNCVSETSGGFTTTYQFSDRAVPTSGGDPLSFSSFVELGAYTVKNKNLISGANVSGLITIAVTYEYDAAGKITKASINGGGTTGSYRYQYTCQ